EYKEGALYAQMDFSSADVPGLIILQGQLLQRVIAAMLGENDDSKGGEFRPRTHTPVEIKIARRICGDLVAELADGWPASPPPRIQLEGPTPSPRIAEGVPWAAPLLAATLDFGPPNNPYGFMLVSVPAQITSDVGQSSGGEHSLERIAVGRDMGRVMPVEVDLVAEAGRFLLGLKELRAMDIGTEFDLGPNAVTLLRANGRPIFRGEPGESSGYRSVRITKKLEE
ncbi:MAG: FliM/FliN family flagellar motor switch protein, partial [Myxococcota bacterium]|nr:FliM/FliN family flagellar motor switch protein [Myxococcota bacterium]